MTARDEAREEAGDTAGAPAGEDAIGLRWPFLLLLVGIAGIGPVTMNGVLPATSAVLRDLSTDYGTAQLVLTVFLIANFVAQFVLGNAADRVGRRPVMIVSLAIFTVGSIACALAPTIELLLGARFVQGFGGAACLILPRTIVRDAWPRDRAASVIGYLTTAMMVAPLFGPAIGGWITDTHDWRWMYWGLAVLGGLFTVLAALFQPETRGLLAESRSARHVASVAVPATAGRSPPPVSARTSDGHQPAGAMRELLALGEFRSLALLLAGSVGIYYGFLAGAPFLAMESRGLAASEYGRWFALVGIGYLTGNLVAGRLSARLGAFTMIRLGLVPLVVGVLGFWLLAGWSHPLALFLPMQLCAFSNGLSLPNVISASMSVRPAHAGTASGLAGALQTGIGVLLTLALGFALSASDLWLFVAMSACGALALSGALLSPDVALYRTIATARGRFSAARR